MYKDFYEKYKVDIKNCFKDLKEGRIKKQIPNMLTASRLIAPLFIIPAAFSGNILLAILFTGFFELTDAMDGFAARKLDAVSEFGKDLDPIVDKIFAGLMAIPVVFVNPLMIGNILGEAIIAKVNTDSKVKGNVPRTTVLGKFKTLMMSLSLAASYMVIATEVINPAILSGLLISTGAIQIATAYQYKQIDKEKDLLKTLSKDDKMETKQITNEETTLEKVKRYSRANEISELKKLKDEILNKNKVEDNIKVKKKK